MESIHDKLEKVRKPRVHIRFDVETEGAEQTNDLPFVVGVMGDFSGHPDPSEPPKPLKDRKFIQIDLDNFDEVMARIKPRLDLKVENTLSEDGSLMPVALRFSSMSDFEPGAVVQQVPALKQLLQTRDQLRDLLSKADRSENLETLLERILQNDGELKKLAGALSTTEGKDGGK
ncbi:MAG: type VI secretion system contractile sheath small subunit [Alphaproteobacteria bacterium]|nr:type VI secretion system contractile sheath small subunit [Alphaproteobacteria bacterium]